jgi:hypothetical protein
MGTPEIDPRIVPSSSTTGTVGSWAESAVANAALSSASADTLKQLIP